MPAGPEPTTATFLPVLCGGDLRLDPAVGDGAVGDRAFDRFDGDRIVVDVERAGRLARRRADAAGDLREIVGRVQVARRLFPVAGVDQVVPVRDLVVDRAAGRRAGDGVGAVAVGHAAVHAARRLLADVLLRQRQHEFLVIANALLDRQVVPIVALELEETRDLTHRRHSRRAWASRPRRLRALSARRARGGIRPASPCGIRADSSVQSARISAARLRAGEAARAGAIRMRSRSASKRVRSAEMSTRPCASRSLAWP